MPRKALEGAHADTMGAAADASSEALTAFALATGHRPASRDQSVTLELRLVDSWLIYI